MKLISIFSISILLQFISHLVQGQTNKGYTINGDIKGTKNGDSIFLVHYKGSEADTIAWTRITNNKFFFKGKLEIEPEFFNIYLSKTKVLPVLITNSKITVSGEYFGDNFRHVLVNDSIKVSGSSGNRDFIRYLKYRQPLYLITDSLQKQASVYRKANDFLLVNILDSLRKHVVDSMNGPHCEAFIKANLKSEYIPYLLNQSNVPLDKKKFYYNQLDRKVQESFYGQLLYKNIKLLAKSVEIKVGAKAPDFLSFTPKGDSQSLLEVVHKSKLTLLDFWASWCMPCRAENPVLKNIYESYKEKGFNILSVSFDFNKNAWLRAIDDDEMTWTHLSDLKYRDSDIHTLYNINGIPINYLINPDGKILAINLHGEDLENAISSILKK